MRRGFRASVERARAAVRAKRVAAALEDFATIHSPAIQRDSAGLAGTRTKCVATEAAMAMICRAITMSACNAVRKDNHAAAVIVTGRTWFATTGNARNAGWMGNLVATAGATAPIWPATTERARCAAPMAHLVARTGA